MQTQERPAVAIVVAGGTGTRMGTDGDRKKQYLLLAGKPLMLHALCALEACARVSHIVTVVTPGDEAFVRDTILSQACLTKLHAVVPGGKNRYHSVFAGLTSAAPLCAPDTAVLVQDAARPFLTGEMIGRVLDGVHSCGACIAAVPLKDTVKQVDDRGIVTQTPDRRALMAVQTPQGFLFSELHAAYQRLMQEEKTGVDLSFVTDDACVMEHFYPDRPILAVNGSDTNFKVTTPADLACARALMQDNEKHPAS